jgi:hypothetical protein
VTPERWAKKTDEEGRRVRSAKGGKKTPPEENPIVRPVGLPGFRFGVHSL